MWSSRPPEGFADREQSAQSYAGRSDGRRDRVVGEPQLWAAGVGLAVEATVGAVIAAHFVIDRLPKVLWLFAIHPLIGLLRPVPGAA